MSLELMRAALLRAKDRLDPKRDVGTLREIEIALATPTSPLEGETPEVTAALDWAAKREGRLHDSGESPEFCERDFATMKTLAARVLERRALSPASTEKPVALPEGCPSDLMYGPGYFDPQTDRLRHAPNFKRMVHPKGLGCDIEGCEALEIGGRAAPASVREALDRVLLAADVFNGMGYYTKETAMKGAGLKGRKLKMMTAIINDPPGLHADAALLRAAHPLPSNEQEKP